MRRAGDRRRLVDESKQRDYLLVAAVVMPGQRRLHMKKESDA